MCLGRGLCVCLSAGPGEEGAVRRGDHCGELALMMPPLGVCKRVLLWSSCVLPCQKVPLMAGQ